MAELTSSERLIRVLKREEPDRAPHFEWSVDQVVRQALVPGCENYIEFAVAMGHDAILVDPDFAKKQVGPDRWWNEWGFVAQYNMEEHGIEVECPCAALKITMANPGQRIQVVGLKLESPTSPSA